MGREIRRVPADWEHPLQECKHSPWRGGCDQAKANGGKCYHPLYDRPYREAVAEWKTEFAAWERGERDEYCDAESAKLEYWEWNGNPPEREYYRPDWPEGAATHYQVYETVSEGNPVTPHFATQDELIDYLVTHGDFWDQSRGDGGWSREAAESFVRGRGWSPSMVMEVSANGARLLQPRDGI